MRVMIAEDHPMFRDALAVLLEGTTGVEVVGVVGTGQEAVRLAAELAPDVAVVDLRMPDGDGFAATRAILSASPSTRVLVLTSSEDEVSLSEALAAGASGYVLKSAEPAEIAEAVAAVAAGASVLSDQMLATLRRRVAATPGSRRSRLFPELTDREYDVLRELAEGHDTTTIARQLGMSTKTVRNHVSNVLLKLGVADRPQAIVLAHRAGVGAADPSSRPAGTPG